MRIACISDTHGLHRRIQLLPVDILIHAGDMMPNDDLQHLIDFNKWLGEQEAIRDMEYE